ncbi:hypothetical protein SLA2020_369770 [Shorea laevis]
MEARKRVTLRKDEEYPQIQINEIPLIEYPSKKFVRSIDRQKITPSQRIILDNIWNLSTYPSESGIKINVIRSVFAEFLKHNKESEEEKPPLCYILTQGCQPGIYTSLLEIQDRDLPFLQAKLCNSYLLAMKELREKVGLNYYISPEVRLKSQAKTEDLVLHRTKPTRDSNPTINLSVPTEKINLFFPTMFEFVYLVQENQEENQGIVSYTHCESDSSKKCTRHCRTEKCPCKYLFAIPQAIINLQTFEEREGGGIHYHKRDCFSILIDKIIHLSGFVINFLSLALHFEAAADIIKKASKYMGIHKAFLWPGVIIARGIWLWSLIIKCLCFIFRKIFQFLLLKDMLDEMNYVSREPLTKDLWKFIFLELKDKSKYADNPRTIRQLCTARGDWVLKDGAWEGCSRALIPFLADVSYDHGLLLWHIATKLCYNTNTNEVNNESPDKCGFCSNNYREFSKILSDHMLYLLLVEPKIMSTVVGIEEKIFQETCNEAERFFTENGLGPKQLKRACEQILSINTNTVNEVTSQSVLFDAVNLANKLKMLQQENGVDIWKLLSKVWMEMLGCAAYHCSSHEHAQQLSRGGELISFVWIVMAHFGLGGRFQDMRIESENV